MKFKDLVQKYNSLAPYLKFALNIAVLGAVTFVFYKFFRRLPVVHDFYELMTYNLTQWSLDASKLGFDLLGYKSEIVRSKGHIYLEGTVGVHLDRGCLGRNLMLTYIGFLLAYPGNIRSKLWYIPVGVVVIFYLNSLRIIGLGFILLYIPKWMNEFHEVIFKGIVYLFIFLMWYNWIRKYSVTADKPKQKKTNENNVTTNTDQLSTDQATNNQ